MVDDIQPDAAAELVCTWCSAPLGSPDLARCPSCGAILHGDLAEPLPGVTAVDAAALVRGMIAAVKIPITAKMRLGWDDDNLTAPDLARVLEDAGVAAIFVHGRTRAQGFSGTVNLAGIRAVVAAVKSIPVIGNGDVTTPEAAKHMLEETGCAGVSIGRGAFYDPWIFRRTNHLLRTGELLPEPDFAERLRVLQPKVAAA